MSAIFLQYDHQPTYQGTKHIVENPAIVKSKNSICGRNVSDDEL